ncbi:MAG TPA: hypothetical protein TECP_00228 [Hyphomicrobiaceae bacterium MAG_BT-2024]
MEIISWILFTCLIAGILTLGVILLRGYLEKDVSAGILSSGLFNSKIVERRLDVVDQLTIDGRRRLVLVRRDNKEHLIMTGGPADVVIETNISTNGDHVRQEPGETAIISDDTQTLVTSKHANDTNISS